jgi:hypothetical protein
LIWSYRAFQRFSGARPLTRTVEDGDVAQGRCLLVDAPEKVVPPLQLVRGLEADHAAALRVDRTEHGADGAVLAAAVHGLQHDE